MTSGIAPREPTHFERYWEESLAHNLRRTVDQWYASFASDHALLVRRNIDRECARRDIDSGVWTAFFRDIVAFRQIPPDPYELIESVLFGPHQKEFLLPGAAVNWRGDICHYERLDRFVEYGLRLPIAGDSVLQRIAELIESGHCNGEDLEGHRIGRIDKPFWVTDDTMAAETDSDRVRDRLGLRALNQIGYRLVEIRYSAAYLIGGKRTPVKAPTVLDSWQDGPRGSWIFTKRREEGAGPEAGRTIDISGGEGKTGVIEAVHASVYVLPTEGYQFQLRVLRPTAYVPEDMSLVRLLENEAI